MSPPSLDRFICESERKSRGAARGCLEPDPLRRRRRMEGGRKRGVSAVGGQSPDSWRGGGNGKKGQRGEAENCRTKGEDQETAKWGVNVRRAKEPQ